MIACHGEFPRTELLAAAKKIAATELAKFEPKVLSRGDKFADRSPAAWIKHALLKAGATAFSGYLSERMNSDL